MKPTKEEIARVDLVHRRADEAAAMLANGVVLGSAVLLMDSENNGAEVMWNEELLNNWRENRQRALSMLNSMETVSVILNSDGRPYTAGSANLEELVPWAREAVTLGRVIYQESAIYLAAYPPPDPYARHRMDENSIERTMAREGFHRKVEALKKEQGSNVLLETFPTHRR